MPFTPITLPDGTVYQDTVHLNKVIDHPRMEIGDYSYFTHSGKPEEKQLSWHPICFRAFASGW